MVDIIINENFEDDASELFGDIENKSFDICHHDNSETFLLIIFLSNK